MHVPIAHIKKECAKNNKYRVLYEPFNPFFFERKKYSFSKKEKKFTNYEPYTAKEHSQK